MNEWITKVKKQFKTLSTAALAGTLLMVPAISQARETVDFKGVSKGQILIKTEERKLYVGIGNGQAIKYPVAVGRAGKKWSGTTFIISKRIKPAWSPPAEIKRDHPNIPDVIKGGSPRNPMGAAALVLAKGQYAIHGTNRPESIGKSVSYGCIRMYNEDVMDLYKRVRWGARVKVVH